MYNRKGFTGYMGESMGVYFTVKKKNRSSKNKKRSRKLRNK